jgi:hypothetical protein
MTEGREFAPRGPIEVAEFLDVKAQELAQLDALLQQADEKLEEAELAWEEHYDQVLEDLEEEISEEGGRMPGEDQRVSLARRAKGGREAWRTYRRARRLVGRLRSSASITNNAISACQSEAKLITAGATAPPQDQRGTREPYG